HGNLRAALEWCGATETGAEAGLRLSAALGWFWIMRNYFREGQQAREGALTRGSEASPALRARALAMGLPLADFSGSGAPAEQLGEECLRLAREAGEGWAAAFALFSLGMQAMERHDFARATPLAEQSLVTARTVGDPWLIAQPLVLLGI